MFAPRAAASCSSPPLDAPSCSPAQRAASRLAILASALNLLLERVPGGLRVAEARTASAPSATSSSSCARSDARCSDEAYMCLLAQLSRMTLDVLRIHRHGARGNGSATERVRSLSSRSALGLTCCSKNSSK